MTARAKEGLDRLRAEMVLRGERVTLQQMVDRLVDFARKNREQFMPRRKGRDPLEEALRKPLDWGVKTSSEEIDQWVYGRPDSADLLSSRHHRRRAE
ncbi:MAG: hypothetical protein QXO51_08740 [Halobacteria archaeon]